MYEMGELLVGAYLQVVRKCSFVLYNQRPEGGGIEGLGELDVVGISDHTVYLCEVTTHVKGIDPKAVARIEAKFGRQRAFAKRHFKDHDKVFELWSPYVPRGDRLDRLSQIRGLDLVVNAEYARRVRELEERARKSAEPTGNDAFRLLQILGHLKEWEEKPSPRHPRQSIPRKR